MHAEAIVSRFIERALTPIHGGRRRVLIEVVWATMRGSAVTLSRLARGIVGRGTSLKPAIKRVDRLIGHARVAREVSVVAQALLKRLARWLNPLVIAVDWSAVTPGGTFVELRAAVVWLGMGRGLTVYQRVYPASDYCSPQAEQALLRDLACMIPRGTRVIVISDAGFHTPWFRAVARQGWSWIGRVRGGHQIGRLEGSWRDALQWGRSATPQPRRWTDCVLTRSKRLDCDVVAVRRRVVGRRVYRRPGHGPSPKAAKEARNSAREPWLLAHSREIRDLRADEIVALYARRMQIEENFRDTKSLQFGMGTAIGRSRSALRLQALLLIASLAAFLLWHLGQLAEAEGLHKRFKATTRAAREISIITLAILLCADGAVGLTTQAIAMLKQRLDLQ